MKTLTRCRSIGAVPCIHAVVRIEQRRIFDFLGLASDKRKIEVNSWPLFLGIPLVTLHQTEFRSVEQRDGHRGGWSSALDRLEEFLTTGTVTPAGKM
jgi:hypothetical protein